MQSVYGLSSAALLVPLLFAAGCESPPATPAPPVREAVNSQLPTRPYSQAYRVGDTYYFAGKVGVTEETMAMKEGRIEAETRNVMESFEELFQEVGVSWSDVVQGTVYLTDVGDYDGMNRIYGEYFPTDPPARECVAVRGIVGDGIVEISFVAVAR